MVAILHQLNSNCVVGQTPSFSDLPPPKFAAQSEARSQKLELVLHDVGLSLAVGLVQDVVKL